MDKSLDLLIGPTASGKSAVAWELARRRGAEVLSVDSMKVYKRLNIGVAKPSPAQAAAVRYHLVDWKEPWEACSVAEWLHAAEQIISEAAARGSPLLAEGGTALYIKALREGLFSGPGRDPALRKQLEDEAHAAGVDKLYARLREVDPTAAARILPGDLRRIVRALEVHALTGRPISAHQSQWGVLRSDLRVRVAGLSLDRKALYARIDERLEKMLAAGWLDECRALLALEQEVGRPLSREAQQALGYRTWFAHLRGELGYAEARERVRFDTHHFARRQLMWFRRFPQVTWIEVQPAEPAAEIADRLAALWTA